MFDGWALHSQYTKMINDSFVSVTRILPPVPSYSWDTIRAATGVIRRYATADSSVSPSESFDHAVPFPFFHLAFAAMR